MPIILIFWLLWLLQSLRKCSVIEVIISTLAQLILIPTALVALFTTGHCWLVSCYSLIFFMFFYNLNFITGGFLRVGIGRNFWWILARTFWYINTIVWFFIIDIMIILKSTSLHSWVTLFILSDLLSWIMLSK